MLVYVESPFDRIVNVHFGGGPIVVAQVPGAFAYLLSLEPRDPADGIVGDEQLTWSGIYDENVIIPVDDYTSRPLNTTANIHAGTPIIDGIADTSLLTVGTGYKITGTGILPNTTMTYGGAAAGTLSNNGTLDIAGAAVEIRIKIWSFNLSAGHVHFTDGTVGTQRDSEYWIDAEWGDATYVRDPFMLAQADIHGGHTDAELIAQTDALYSDLLAQGYPDYSLFKHYSTGGIHNGVNLASFPYSVFQFWSPMDQAAQIYLINMAFGKLIQVNQLVYDEAYFGGTTGFLPGYLATVGGTKLTAYPSGTQFSLVVQHGILGGWAGDFPSLTVKVKAGTTTDPATGLPMDIPAVPSWAATVPPMEHPPAGTVEIARFNASGLVPAPAPALVLA